MAHAVGAVDVQPVATPTRPDHDRRRPGKTPTAPTRRRIARALTVLGLAGVLACTPPAPAAVATGSAAASASEAWMHIGVATFNAGGRAVWTKTKATDRCAMARTVTRSAPSIILFQEVPSNGLPDRGGRTMLQEVVALMKNTSCTNGRSYTRAAVTSSPTDTPLVTRSGPRIERDFGVHRIRTTQIFYDPRHVTFLEGESRPLWHLLPPKLASGSTVRHPQEEYLRLLQIGGGGRPNANSKYFTLARFRVKGGEAGRSDLIVADLHLPCLYCVTDQARSQELQVMMIKGLLKQIRDEAAPLIVGGDLNQRPGSRPSKAGRDLRRALEAGGLRDARDLMHNSSDELEGVYVRGGRAPDRYLGTMCTAYTVVARREPYDHPTVLVRVGMRVT